MPAKQITISRHFALIWMSLVLLLVFFTALYYASNSNPFYSNVDWTIVGLLAGLIGGKEAQ